MEKIPLTSQRTKVIITSSFGAVLKYTTADLDWFRPTPEDFHLATDCSCFPLIPFCNRIAQGKFQFLGKYYTIPIAETEPNALHGQGWINNWKVQKVTPTSCQLSYTCKDKALYPFEYEAKQIFALDGDNFKITISIKSLEDTMPVGIGLHPYFPKTDFVKVQAQVRKMWKNNQNLIPISLEKNPICEELTQGCFQPKKNILDNSFTDWNAIAKISWENRDLVIKADPVFQFLACYTPPENFFCLEPVSNVPDAFNFATQNKTPHGMITLAKNEVLTGTVVFQPTIY